MKVINFVIFSILILFLSGCVVYSFYPLYTEKDLFANEILKGNWEADNGALWSFEYAYLGEKVPENIDSTSYVLNMVDKDEHESEYRVHIIKLGGNYFLDFYLKDFLNDDNLDLASFHIVPVHTFAKLIVTENQLQINWFDQSWLEDLIKENKINIRYENNDDFILLTAKPGELQKFVAEYANSEKAFKEGMEAVLTRK
ncbi:MAG: hypothetical protein KAH68_09025 [Draconibacterium sp.]|nr:hypothetical protein [Draconibacterium sp.]